MRGRLVAAGALIVRVHDVAEMVDVVKVANAVGKINLRHGLTRINADFYKSGFPLSRE